MLHNNLIVVAKGSSDELLRLLTNVEDMPGLPDSLPREFVPQIPHTAKEIKRLSVEKARDLAYFIGAEQAEELFKIDKRLTVRRALLLNENISEAFATALYGWARVELKRGLSMKEMGNLVAKIDLVTACMLVSRITRPELLRALQNRDLSNLTPDKFTYLNELHPVLTTYLTHVGNLPESPLWPFLMESHFSQLTSVFRETNQGLPLKLVKEIYTRSPRMLATREVPLTPDAKQWLLEQVFDNNGVENIGAVLRFPETRQRLLKTSPSRVTRQVVTSLLRELSDESENYCRYMHTVLDDPVFDCATVTSLRTVIRHALEVSDFDLITEAVRRVSIDRDSSLALSAYACQMDSLADVPESFRQLAWEHVTIKDLPRAMQAYGYRKDSPQVLAKLSPEALGQAMASEREWIMNNFPLGDTVLAALTNSTLLQSWLECKFAANQPTMHLIEKHLTENSWLGYDVMEYLFANWTLREEFLLSVVQGSRGVSIDLLCKWFNNKFAANPFDLNVAVRLLNADAWHGRTLLLMVTPLLDTESGRSALLDSAVWLQSLQGESLYGHGDELVVHMRMLWEFLIENFGNDPLLWRNALDQLDTWPGNIRDLVTVVHATFN